MHFPLLYVVWKVLQKAEFVAIIDFLIKGCQHVATKKEWNLKDSHILPTGFFPAVRQSSQNKIKSTNI